MDKKRLSMFPVTREICAVARYASILQGYDIEDLFAPKFLGLNEVDISSIDGGVISGLHITDYNEVDLKKCDTLYVDYNENLNSLDSYVDVVDSAKRLGKEVLLSQKLLQLLKPYSEWPLEPPLTEEKEDYLYEIPIPVIMVFTQGVRTDQFYVELGLRNYFLQNGYSVSQIGSQEASKLFGFPTLPEFLYQPRDVYEKVLRFNQYVRTMVEREGADLLIIGIPNSILKYNNKTLNGLGVLPLTIGKAVRSDLSILCSYYNSYESKFFEDMKLQGRYCFGGEIEFFAISNSCMFVEPSTDDLEYIDLNVDFVLDGMKNNMSNQEECLFNAYNSESFVDTCKKIHEKLASNVKSV